MPRPLVCVATATSLIVLGHAAPNALARNNGQWENLPAYTTVVSGATTARPEFRVVVRPTSRPDGNDCWFPWHGRPAREVRP